jgi:hypothetical protein
VPGLGNDQSESLIFQKGNQIHLQNIESLIQLCRNPEKNQNDDVKSQKLGLFVPF